MGTQACDWGAGKAHGNPDMRPDVLAACRVQELLQAA